MKMKKVLYIMLLGILASVGITRASVSYTQEMVDAFNWAYAQGLTSTGDINQIDLYSGMNKGEVMQVLNRFISNLHLPVMTGVNGNGLPSDPASGGFLIAHLVPKMWPGNYPTEASIYTKAIQQGLITTTGAMQGPQILGYAFVTLYHLSQNLPTIYTTPTTQSAISGSLVTFTVTRVNGTGPTYLKYILPQTSIYNIAYQNATLTPINNALLGLGIEHDPIFLIPANTTFTVTITGKVITNNRILPATIDTTAVFSSNTQFSSLLASEIAQITPIADLTITNILTGQNPSLSGDLVSYYITLQNIGSTFATGISFVSTFPIPTLGTPTAMFNGTLHLYNFITYPQDFVWTGNYLTNLNPGQITTILLTAPMTQAFAVGTSFNQIATATTTSPEYTTGNNSATATGIVQSAADLWITKTLAPFTGYNAGDKIIYTITYGNSGGKAASNVVITDIAPVGVSLPVTTFTLGSLPAGSGGTIILTGTLNSLLNSGKVFVNTVNITTPSIESSTGNNSATATGTIQGIAHVSLDIIAHNLTRPQYDNAPYGSGPNVMIQAMNGDLIQFTITYANFGNTSGMNINIGLSGTLGLASIGQYNGSIGFLSLNTTGTIVFTGTVGPKNYGILPISAVLTYTALSTYNGQTLTDTVLIQEPLVCGDGFLTRNEPCDTNGNLGVLFSGQVCENQQGSCVLRTTSIVNNACINYQYTNQLGVLSTGQSCSAVNVPLMNASCTSMTGTIPTVQGTGYTVNLTCKGANTLATTPISIDCGNGTTISGTGAMFNGICNYSSSYVGAAQCKVGNDTTNGACRVPVSINAGNCKSLDALDGTIALVNQNGDASSTFRCTTTPGTTAQTMTIDCGNGTQYTTNNASSFEATCKYTNVQTPHSYDVKCSVDGVTTPPVCQQKLIVDRAGLGYCGNGIVEGYEDCDDGSDNGSSSSTCSKGCDLKGSPMVGCFNIGNTSISIQKGEILPFRWTLDKTDNIIKGNSCNGKDNGVIPEDSIMCTFNIYNGEHTETNNDPVNLSPIIKKCNIDNRGNSVAFQYFIDKGWRSLTHSFGRYYVDSHDFVDKTFGEYKISLDKVSYKYCLGDNKEVGTEIDRVCTVDFSVTQPYLAQKSSFGLTPKSTTVPLEGYKMINGDDLINSTDLNNIMVIKEATYNGGNTISTMMNTFITKYSKLAIKYGIIKSDEGNTITTYKVPGQDIVVFKGDGTLTYTEGASKTKPFTVIVDGPSIKINGAIENSNAMFLVNKGNITFLSSADACNKTQVIKGIFVTSKGSFLAGPDLTNTDINKKWCAFGGLKVQGILIGAGIKDLVQSRRSQLNGWFYVGGSSDPSIKAERRNEIFNGASVLIEYSPSLWSALPPGASEFTKALDIYKQ